MVKSIYVIGSMRNPNVPRVAKMLRDAGFEVFDDWYSPGAQADEKWQEYERDRGRTYQEALNGHHAKHVFELDRKHLERCDAAVLVMPAGKSAHIELGWFSRTKPAFVLFDQEPERYDIMYRFLFETGGGVCFSDQELLEKLDGKRGKPPTGNPHCMDRIYIVATRKGSDCASWARAGCMAPPKGMTVEEYYFCGSCREFYK